mgnify:CR=1 FL=1
MPNFDVVIPVGTTDVNFISRVVNYISTCLKDIEYIYIITSDKNIQSVKKQLLSKFNNCIIIDENKLLPNFSFQIIDELLRKYSPNKKQRTGWYYQQFLKLAFAKSKYSHSFYLTWDADTLPLAPITFFEDNHILYNPKKEYNPNYFTTIEKLFGYGKQNKFSYIAEHMLFSTDIVCQMLREIEQSKIKGDSWFEKILSASNFDNPLPCFSEFETYGTYCFVNYPTLYKPRYLNTFREAGFICGRNISDKKLRIMSFDIDTASFEMLHEPMFPYNLPNLWIKYKRRFSKLAKMSLKDLFKKINEKKDSKLDQQRTNDILYRLPYRKNNNKL